jgi:broad specificity phosphatase PhoE
MIIKLIRHGQSETNTGERLPYLVGDHTIGLTPLGWEQARQAGAALGADFLTQALIYHSPYRRACQTLSGILNGANVAQNAVKIYEDARLREIDVGYKEREQQNQLRELHGWFYYRFENGESPADCYDRMCTFLESLQRQVRRRSAQKVLIVTHGFTLRCFVMRFLHLTVQQYETIKNPGNGDLITIEPSQPGGIYQFTNGNWGVSGLRLYAQAEGGQPHLANPLHLSPWVLSRAHMHHTPGTEPRASC